MRSIWIPLEAAAALVLTLIGSPGCSKSGGGGCDSSQCTAGNQCVDDGQGTSCHKVCTQQSDCPANWYCNDGLPGGEPLSWCVQNTATYAPAGGQWYAPDGGGVDLCQASKGEGANPGCDWSQGFACFGISPTDGNAYCTQFACSADTDCPGGWWCATENVGPNATSVNPTFGTTRTVCEPRTYCAPCKKDLDCFAPMGSTPMHCVPDVNGATFCAPQCSSATNCSLDATCTAPWKVCTPAAAGTTCVTDDQCPPTGGSYQHCVGGSCTPECATAADCASDQKCAANTTVCVPRAGVCVGTGGFCSPCRSDDDCKPMGGSLAAPQATGFCLSSEPYSTEHFCSAPSTVADCDGGAGNPPGCPQADGGQNWLVTACTGTGVPGDPPDNQCIGVVSFVASGMPIGIPGCWTVNR